MDELEKVIMFICINLIIMSAALLYVFYTNLPYTSQHIPQSEIDRLHEEQRLYVDERQYRHKFDLMSNRQFRMVLRGEIV